MLAHDRSGGKNFKAIKNNFKTSIIALSGTWLSDFKVFCRE